MKKFIVVLAAAVAAASACAALPSPDLIAQFHFAGAQKISAAQDFSAFTNEFCSAEALALRKQTADKLAPWLAGWLQSKLAVSVPDGAAKLRPLLDDLQKSEWFFETRAAAGGQPQTVIAIKLDAARAQIWQANLKPFFPSASFGESGGWLFFNSIATAATLQNSVVQKISKNDGAWLSLDVNWPRLAQWYPKLKELALPETQFAVAAADAKLRVTGKFFFPENLALNLSTWQFPSNAVHQPLTSFTAVRGFASWLAGQEWARAGELSPAVNQLFIWALNGVPFQTFAAAPVADPAAALRQLDANLQPVVAEQNAHDGFISKMTLNNKENQITLTGAPIIAPFIKPDSSPAGQFLVAGVFPNTPRGRPLPPELFASLAVKNLVYYHWEITGERLPSLLQVSQLSLMLTRHRQVDGKEAAFKWADKIGRTLGNTVTEITQTAPDQMTFTRTAPGGLTALELMALADWLDDPKFPHFDSKLPPISERLKLLRARHAHPTPAPAPPH